MPAAPHRRGFYLVKKGFVRELSIVEIPVEPRVRSNLIPGRARERRRGRGCPASPTPLSFRIIRNNSSYLSSVSARYRTCMYTGRDENETTEEMSRRAWRFSRMLKRYQLFVTDVARLANDGYGAERYVKIEPRSSSEAWCRRWWCSRSVIQSGNGIPVVVRPAASLIKPDRRERILTFGQWISFSLLLPAQHSLPLLCKIIFLFVKDIILCCN